LIVMGTHGRGFVGHVVMGSVAEKVVRGASCPVLTVRGASRVASTAAEVTASTATA
jgi:nucleotide-binding universal stress UspA family protein